MGDLVGVGITVYSEKLPDGFNFKRFVEHLDKYLTGYKEYVCPPIC